MKFYICLLFLAAINLDVFSQVNDKLISEGKEEFAKGNYSKSIELFEKELKLNPRAKEVNFFAGLAAYNLKDFKTAKKYFSNEVKNNKAYTSAYIYRAKSNKKSCRKALKDLQKAEKLSDRNPEVLLARADLFFDYKKYGKAFEEYAALLILKPGHDDTYYKMGYCKYLLNDSAAACSYWKKIDDTDDFENAVLITKTCNSK